MGPWRSSWAKEARGCRSSWSVAGLAGGNQCARGGHDVLHAWQRTSRAELAGLGIGPVKDFQKGWNGLPKWVRFGPQIGPWVIIGSWAWGPTKIAKLKITLRE